MTPQQHQRRQIAREILTHILIHKYLDNTGIADNAGKVAAVLERAGVIKMEPNLIDWVIADKRKAEFLVHG